MNDETMTTDNAADSTAVQDAFMSDMAQSFENEPDNSDLPQPTEAPEQAEEKQPQPTEAPETFDSLMHKYKSTNGRISAYQKQIDELKAKVESKTDAKADKNQEGFGAQFPEMAQEIERLVEERTQALLSERMAQVAQLEELRLGELKQAEFEQTVSIMKQVHPDFLQVVQSQEFSRWLEGQPPSVRNMYNSDDVRDSEFLIRSFKANFQGVQPAVTQTASVVQQRKAVLSASATPAATRQSRTVDQGSDLGFEDGLDSYLKNRYQRK